MKPDEITLDTEVIDDALSAVKLARADERISDRHVFVLGQPLPQERSPIDAFYRGVLKEDTLFVFSPQLVAPREQGEDAPAGDDAPSGGIF